MKLNEVWDDTKRKAFEGATKRGALLELVKLRGGTGELRKPLTEKAYMKRKKRLQMAKASRKGNR